MHLTGSSCLGPAICTQNPPLAVAAGMGFWSLVWGSEKGSVFLLQREEWPFSSCCCRPGQLQALGTFFWKQLPSCLLSHNMALPRVHSTRSSYPIVTMPAIGGEVCFGAVAVAHWLWLFWPLQLLPLSKSPLCWGLGGKSQRRVQMLLLGVRHTRGACAAWPEEPKLAELPCSFFPASQVFSWPLHPGPGCHMVDLPLLLTERTTTQVFLKGLSSRWWTQ